MEKLIIERYGDDLPLVVFDTQNWFFRISGNILIENEKIDLFFIKLYEWLKINLKPNQHCLKLYLYLDRFSTYGQKSILELLKFFKKIIKLKVVWILYYEDEDMDELAVNFSKILEVKFEMQRVDVDEIPLFDKTYYV